MLSSLEAAAQRCSVKKLFRKFPEKSQERSMMETYFSKVVTLH